MTDPGPECDPSQIIPALRQRTSYLESQLDLWRRRANYCLDLLLIHDIPVDYPDDIRIDGDDGQYVPEPEPEPEPRPTPEIPPEEPVPRPEPVPEEIQPLDPIQEDRPEPPSAWERFRQNLLACRENPGRVAGIVAVILGIAAAVIGLVA
eukprot:813086_1